jgi:hypothetical protein
MPDPDGQTAGDEKNVPQTSLHAYKEGREEDVKGDVEKLKSGDNKEMQQQELDADDEPDTPAKH